MAKKLKFPDGFLWGAGTSAFQVEGNIKNNWSVWCEQNAERLAKESITKYGHLESWEHIRTEALDPQNYIPGRVAEFEKHYESDLDIAKSLGHNANRFSIEWARVEPSEGVFDEMVIEEYKKIASRRVDLDRVTGAVIRAA